MTYRHRVTAAFCALTLTTAAPAGGCAAGPPAATAAPNGQGSGGESTVHRGAKLWPDLDAAAARVGGGEKDAAVIVGIEKYTYLPHIRGAKDNAKLWHRYLTEDLGVPLERAKLITDKTATREEILRSLKRAATQAEAGGKVWFIFVGHGAPVQVDPADLGVGEAAAAGPITGGALMGVDTQQSANSLVDRGLALHQAYAALDASKAQPVLLIDACFSGKSRTGDQLVSDLMPTTLANVAAPRTSTAMVLAAAAADQFAGPLPGDQRPAFSYLVLGGLRGWADSDTDGVVTAAEAVSYANSAMAALVDDREQTAELAGQTEGIPLARSAGDAGPDLGELARTLGEERPSDVLAGPDGRNGRGLLIGGVTSLVAGLGGVGVAIGGAVVRQDATNDFQNLPTLTEREEALDRQAQGENLIIAGSVIAGVGLITGAALLGVYARRRKSPSVAVAPSAGRDGAGMVLQVRF